MKKKYPVILSEAQREHLKSLIAAGTAPVPASSPTLGSCSKPRGSWRWVDEQVAEAVETSQPTVARVRKQYFEEDLQAALNRRPPKRQYHRKLDAEQEEARSIALACSEPPEKARRPAGVYECWPTSWLSSRSWKRRSPTRRAKKNSEKNALKPHLKKQWCIPSEANAE